MKVDTEKMPENMRRAERLKNSLEKVAMISLFFDIAIAVVTLLSLNFGKMEITDKLIVLLNYALTIIVIVSIAIFITMLLVKHYQDLVEIMMMRKWRK